MYLCIILSTPLIWSSGTAHIGFFIQAFMLESLAYSNIHSQHIPYLNKITQYRMLTYVYMKKYFTPRIRKHINAQSNCIIIILHFCFKYYICYLLVRKPEKAQLIQPPIMIIGRTLVTLPFNMSVIILGSEIYVHVQQNFNGLNPDGLLLCLRTLSWVPMIPYMRCLWSEFCIYVFMLLLS